MDFVIRNCGAMSPIFRITYSTNGQSTKLRYSIATSKDMLTTVPTFYGVLNIPEIPIHQLEKITITAS